MSDHYEQRLHTEKTLPYLKASVPEGLKRILQNACEYEPTLRYQTAVEMKKDLCRLMEDTSYIPKATRDTNYFSRKTISPTGATQTSSELIHQSRNIIQSGPAAFQRQLQKNSFLQPETAWKAGKLWYEESRKAGSRFAGLDIDKRIMPLSSPSSHVMNFPIRVSENLENADDQKPLAEILDDTENLRNMYLIGGGGIGKTTALNFVMEYTYKDKDFFPAAAKNVIPLFIELSKAPADYCNAYRSSHSTLIQRYLYMLLGSVEKQCLLSENSKEMSQIMNKEDTSMTDYMEQLLNTDKENTKYLLLLDGLNEVSKKQLSTKEKDFLGTPSELIVDEIKELLEKHKNITAIITSRADETLYDLDASFKRLYLTGVSEPVIKDYLANCKISLEMVCKNSRLMETLRIPLFLKLYAQLYNTADISTPGEILYAFFSERSTKYTVRNRIAEIKLDRKKAGDGYVSNSLDEKMQWFILDFILPEIGWYMEKNDLFAQYCVYSLGILYANNQSYSFIHQHIRDFFCAMKIITDMKMALYVAEEGSILENHDENNNKKKTVLRILNTIGADYLDEKVSLFIGEILGEYKNTFQFIDGKWQIYIQEEKRLLLTRTLSLYRENFSRKSTISIAVHNLIDIFEKSHGNLNNMDLSELDLSRCNFNGIPLKEASLNGALVTKQTFFPNGHGSSITCIRISPNVHDGTELLISTIKGAWIYDTRHYEIKSKYCNTYFALSDNNAKK